MTGTRMLTRRQVRGRLIVAMLLALPVLCYQAGAGASAPPELQRSYVIENRTEPFSISLVPAFPCRSESARACAFSVSSSTAGYYGLYLIDPVGEVWVLAENLPLPAGSVTYPSPPAQNFTLAAARAAWHQPGHPAGHARSFWRAFPATTPDPGGSLAIRGGTFVSRLNDALSGLPKSDWATDEITVRVVA